MKSPKSSLCELRWAHVARVSAEDGWTLSPPTSAQFCRAEQFIYSICTVSTDTDEWPTPKTNLSALSVCRPVVKHTCTSCRHAYQPCTLLSSTCGTFTLFCFIQILAWLHDFHCLTWICIDLFYSLCSLIPAEVKSNAAAGGRKILLWSESLTLPVTQTNPEYVTELWMLFKKNWR